MSEMKAILGQMALAAILILGSLPALGEDVSFQMSPPGGSAVPQYGQIGTPPPPLPSADGIAWPPPGGRPVAAPRPYDFGRPDAMVPASPVALPPVVSCPTPIERVIESTWYYRLDAFYWNERGDGGASVNEAGPLSTIGYLRRSGPERFRFELFGGTVSYDGAAMYNNGTEEPYHQANGTDYLGIRGEYELLIEPAAWSRVRLLAGVGTRFWFRDLQDAVTPSGNEVAGYQESWWTFYPYVGLETKESDEPGLKWFGSARFGITPLTHQYATYFDTVVYPRCGVTGRAELGVYFQRLWASAVVEVMTWSESADVEGTFQPASRMLTIGGQLGYTF
jgi:hypothetical protein